MSVQEGRLSSTEIFSPFAAQIIQHLIYQGNRNDCAPFTAATLIHAFTNQKVDPVELSREMNRPAWRGLLPVIRRIPNWATFPWGVVDVLRQYGVSASWRLFLPVQELLCRLSMPILHLPILVSWKPLWAHIMTLIAYRPGHGFGFANTQSPRAEIDWLTEKRFLQLWEAACRCTVIVDPYSIGAQLSLSS
ncbi:MAG: hypothetical protein RML93_12890 [Anaerolineales bacterium]|nr:hypothetical protein [Anaerolineales bacterium]MDW8448171.1 hypothetical protein [Anaerolineales bacterium]